MPKRKTAAGKTSSAASAKKPKLVAPKPTPPQQDSPEACYPPSPSWVCVAGDDSSNGGDSISCPASPVPQDGGEKGLARWSRDDRVPLSFQLEINAGKAIETVSPGQHYDALDKNSKRELFMAVWEDWIHLSLVGCNQSLATVLLKSMPNADRILLKNFQISNIDPRYNPDGSGSYDNSSRVTDGWGQLMKPQPKKFILENKRTGAVNLACDGYMVRSFFQKKWRFRFGLDNPSKCEPESLLGWPPLGRAKKIRRDPMLLWDSSQLFHNLDGADHQKLRVAYERYPFSDKPFQKGEAISSQLLLYRLTCTFGMLPTGVGFHSDKQLWSVFLSWKDDNDVSFVRFCDRTGSWDVSFSGCQEASESALQLIQWLVSDNVPSFSYMLAGRRL